MINSILIDQFKVYRSRQKVELAPLTLIVGVNNSGKSTLFDALLLLATANVREVFRNEDFHAPLTLPGNQSLGSNIREARVRNLAEALEPSTILGIETVQGRSACTLTYTHGGPDPADLRVNFTTQASGQFDPIPWWAVIFDVGRWIQERIDLKVEWESDPHSAEAELQGLLGACDNMAWIARMAPPYPEVLPQIMHEHDGGWSTIAKLCSGQRVSGVFDRLANEHWLITEIFFQRDFYRFAERWAGELIEKLQSTSVEVPEFEEGVIRRLLNLFDERSSNDRVSIGQLERALEPASLGQILERGDSVVRAWLEAESGTPSGESKRKERRAHQRKWLGFLDRMRLFAGESPAFKQHVMHQRDQTALASRGSKDRARRIEKTLRKFGMRGVKVSVHGPDTRGNIELTIRTEDGREHNLADLGLGLRRIISLMLTTFTNTPFPVSDSGLFLVEEPEAHLHQRAQAELGDFFIRQMREGKGLSQYLIETHSPHLLYRVLRRVRETGFGILEDQDLALSNNDLKVLCVVPHEAGSPEQGSFVQELMVSPNGVLLDPLPTDFFDSTLSDRHEGWPEF